MPPNKLLKSNLAKEYQVSLPTLKKMAKMAGADNNNRYYTPKELDKIYEKYGKPLK